MFTGWKYAAGDRVVDIECGMTGEVVSDREDTFGARRVLVAWDNGTESAVDPSRIDREAE